MQYSPFLAMLLTLSAEYSTYIGDENAWRISKLIADASGNTYVAGSRTFNLGHDPLDPDLGTEAIVAKVDTSGKTVVFAGIGGKGNEVARAVAVDRAGNLYLAGSTTSPNFPLRKALFTAPSAGFLVKYNADATEVLWSTYFPAAIEALAVDGDGAVYCAGTTFSPGVPVTPGLPSGPTPSVRLYGAFLTKIAPGGDRVVYSTVISGQQKNCSGGSSCFTAMRGASASAVAVDAAGDAYIAGNSDVKDLPTTPGVLFPVGVGAWVGKVNAGGTALAYLTYFGDSPPDFGPLVRLPVTARGLAVDGSGNAYVAGAISSDAFALKLNASATAVLWKTELRGSADEEAKTAALDASGRLWVAGTTTSADFPNADGWSGGPDFVVRFDPAGAIEYAARYPAGVVQSIAADSLLHMASEGGVLHAVAASPRPAMRPWSIGPLGGQVAPGEVIAIYGPHIGAPVFIDDVATPVLYSGDGQVNTIVPFEIAGRKTVRIRIGPGPEFVAGVLPAIPQIFALVNQDGTVNSPDNPARVGSIMTAWVTGSGYPEHLGLLYADGKLVSKVYEGGYQINFVAPNSGSIVLTSGIYASAPFEIHVVP